MFALILLTTATLGAFDVQLQTLDGKSISGQLVSLSSKDVLLKVDGKEQTYQLKNVISLSSKKSTEAPQSKATVWVTMVDGTQLAATSYLVQKRQATIALTDKTPITSSTRNIRAVRFAPLSPKLKQAFDTSLRSKDSEDVIIIKNSKGVINALGGVLGDRDKENSKFKLGDETIPVALHKILGQVYFHPRGRQLPPALCVIETTQNQKFAVQEMKIVNSEVAFTTLVGLKLQRPLTSIKRFDFSTGKVTFLSDMQPSEIKWQPYFESLLLKKELEKKFWPRNDRSLLGGKMQINMKSASDDPVIKSFDKGLSIFSQTNMVYRLPEGVRLFQAVAGIDARTRSAGNVLLTIYGDDKKLLETTISGTAKAVPISLKIEKVARLKIVVDFGKNIDVGDYLNLGNARIVK